MIKKLLIVSVLVMSIFAFTVPASATTTSTPYLDDQVYLVSGKITVKIDIKDYVSVSVTIPKVEKYGEMFIFFGDHTWMDYLLYTAATSDSVSGISYPTWTQSGANFTINLQGMANSIQSALGEFVNLSGGATKAAVITGKVSGKSISGKMNLGWNMSTYVQDMGNISGSITVSMTYKGTWYTYVSYSSLAASESKMDRKMDLQQAVKDAVIKALSSLPQKAQNPIK